jgi:hypothetical protein
MPGVARTYIYGTSGVAPRALVSIYGGRGPKEGADGKISLERSSHIDPIYLYIPHYTTTNTTPCFSKCKKPQKPKSPKKVFLINLLPYNKIYEYIL